MSIIWKHDDYHDILKHQLKNEVVINQKNQMVALVKFIVTVVFSLITIML